MSRIGEAHPGASGVNVAITPGRVKVNGPLGELTQVVPRGWPSQRGRTRSRRRPTDRGHDRALHGLTRTLIANMVEGVTNGFERSSRSRVSAIAPPSVGPRSS